MQPNHYDLLSQVQPDPRTPARMTREGNQPLRENGLQSRSSPGVVPVRSEGMLFDPLYIDNPLLSSDLEFDFIAFNMYILWSLLYLNRSWHHVLIPPLLRFVDRCVLSAFVFVHVLQQR